MKLNTFDLDHVNFWNYEICTINGIVVDIVNLNYSDMHLELQFKFPRYKAFCYFDGFRDYAEVYTKRLEYMELFDQLTKHAAYVSHIYEDMLST